MMAETEKPMSPATEPMNRETNDSSDIAKTLNFMHPHGSTFEVCCIGTKKRKLDLWGGEYAGGSKPIVAGWFGDNDSAAKMIAELDERAEPEPLCFPLDLLCSLFTSLIFLLGLHSEIPKIPRSMGKGSSRYFWGEWVGG